MTRVARGVDGSESRAYAGGCDKGKRMTTRLAAVAAVAIAMSGILTPTATAASTPPTAASAAKDGFGKDPILSADATAVTVRVVCTGPVRGYVLLAQPFSQGFPLYTGDFSVTCTGHPQTLVVALPAEPTSGSGPLVRGVVTTLAVAFAEDSPPSRQWIIQNRFVFGGDASQTATPFPYDFVKRMTASTVTIRVDCAGGPQPIEVTTQFRVSTQTVTYDLAQGTGTARCDGTDERVTVSPLLAASGALPQAGLPELVDVRLPRQDPNVQRTTALVR